LDDFTKWTFVGAYRLYSEGVKPKNGVFLSDYWFRYSDPVKNKQGRKHRQLNQRQLFLAKCLVAVIFAILIPALRYTLDRVGFY